MPYSSTKVDASDATTALLPKNDMATSITDMRMAGHPGVDYAVLSLSALDLSVVNVLYRLDSSTASMKPFYCLEPIGQLIR